MIRKISSFIAIVVLFTSHIFGSGFQINEHGAKAMALAGAFTAIANDASAVHFNAAGITQLSGANFMAGVTLISPTLSFRGVSPAVDEYELEKQVFTPINFYYTQQLCNDLTFGLGVNNQYGLGTKWPADWVGKYLAYDTSVETYFFNPVLAYKLSDKLSISAGAIYAYGKVKIHSFFSLAPFSGDALVKLDGDGTAWGITAAIFYHPIEQLSFGVSFKSECKFNFTGDAAAEAPAQFAPLLPSGGISAELATPMNMTFGFGFFPSPSLQFSGDIQFVKWSSYKELAVKFDDPNQQGLSSPRNYIDTYIARFGVQYSLSRSFDLRAGILYDKNPVLDEYVEPTLPDADRLAFNVGFGYDLTDNLTFDLAYMFLRFAERKIATSMVEYTEGNSKFNGVYNGTGHLFAVNFSFNF